MYDKVSRPFARKSTPQPKHPNVVPQPFIAPVHLESHQQPPSKPGSQACHFRPDFADIPVRSPHVSILSPGKQSSSLPLFRSGIEQQSAQVLQPVNTNTVTQPASAQLAQLPKASATDLQAAPDSEDAKTEPQAKPENITSCFRYNFADIPIQSSDVLVLTARASQQKQMSIGHGWGDRSGLPHKTQQNQMTPTERSSNRISNPIAQRKIKRPGNKGFYTNETVKTEAWYLDLITPEKQDFVKGLIEREAVYTVDDAIAMAHFETDRAKSSGVVKIKDEAKGRYIFLASKDIAAEVAEIYKAQHINLVEPKLLDDLGKGEAYHTSTKQKRELGKLISSALLIDRAPGNVVINCNNGATRTPMVYATYAIVIQDQNKDAVLDQLMEQYARDRPGVFIDYEGAYDTYPKEAMLKVAKEVNTKKKEERTPELAQEWYGAMKEITAEFIKQKPQYQNLSLALLNKVEQFAKANQMVPREKLFDTVKKLIGKEHTQVFKTWLAIYNKHKLHLSENLSEEVEEEKSENLSEEIVEEQEKVEQEKVPLIKEQEKNKGEEAGRSGLVNLNMGTYQELTSLPGIGQAIALAILEWRQSNKFTKLQDLRRHIRGVGNKTLEQLRDRVTW